MRHNLDVMHVEKNICESILCTLLDISGKTKDGLNARKDLEDWDIRHDLHPYVEGMRTYLPAAPHSLSKVEKKIFCERLFNMKLPDGYKITNLKSHDYHILVQQLLPVVIRGLLPKGLKKCNILDVVHFSIRYVNELLIEKIYWPLKVKFLKQYACLKDSFLLHSLISWYTYRFI